MWICMDVEAESPVLGLVAEWARENLARRAAKIAAGEGGPTLGTHLLLGPESPRMADHLARHPDDWRLLADDWWE